MKNLRTFEQFVNESEVNEASSPPSNVGKVAKKFKVTPQEHYDLENVWELYIGDLQVMWVAQGDGHGEQGWQIADEDGNELYMGTDDRKAIAVIQKNK